MTLALRKLKVPDTVILSPDSLQADGGTAMEQALPSLQLLKTFGLLKGDNDFKIPPKVITHKQDVAKTEVRPAEGVK